MLDCVEEVPLDEGLGLEEVAGEAFFEVKTASKCLQMGLVALH